MNDLIAILASVTVVSLISLIGVMFIGLKGNLLKNLLMALVAFASGTLLGGAFIHLLPESISEASAENSISPFYFVVLGMVSFFVMEKFLYWRHCHEDECPAHMFVYLNLVGDGLHNFIDGMIIAVTYIISFDLGFVTTLAVMFHEIPQEIGDFGILLYGGLDRKKALTYNFISAITAVLGAITAYFLQHMQTIEMLLVPFAAGGFIYIAAADLMPELHKRSRIGVSIIQFLAILFGITLMIILKIVMNA